MQFSTFIISAASLLTLVAGDACVVGGPANEVTAAKDCCHRTPGEWKQYYPVQAICVVANSTKTAVERAQGVDAEAAAATAVYTACVKSIDGKPLDLRCIEGESGLDKIKSKRDAEKFARRA